MLVLAVNVGQLLRCSEIQCENGRSCSDSFGDELLSGLPLDSDFEGIGVKQRGQCRIVSRGSAVAYAFTLSISRLYVARTYQRERGVPLQRCHQNETSFFRTSTSKVLIFSIINFLFSFHSAYMSHLIIIINHTFTYRILLLIFFFYYYYFYKTCNFNLTLLITLFFSVLPHAF